MSLPFQNTAVSEIKSVSEIVGYLKDVGFQKIAQVSDNGRQLVVASHNGAEFRFEVNLEGVKKVFWDDLGPIVRRKCAWPDEKKKMEEKLEKKALRAGWRLIAYQVKSLHDSIKMGVVEISQAFGGYLTFTGKDGKRQYLSDFIIQNIANGSLQSGQALAQIGYDKERTHED